MRNLTLILVAIFILLRFGYPQYQDWKLEKEIRKAMQSDKEPNFENNFDDLPVKAEFEKNYPNTKMTLTMTEVANGQLNTSQLVELNKQIKDIPCRNLVAFQKDMPDVKIARAKIMLEDKVSATIVVKSKTGNVIDQHTQILSECDNFSSVFSSPL